MIYAVLGDRGAGKSTFITYTAYKEYMQYGRKVVCNYKLNFPPSPTGGKVIEMSLAEVVELPDELNDALLLLDEFHLIVNSRKVFAKSNEKYIKLVTQLRKRNITFMFATQRLRMVDVQIRDQVDFIVVIENMHRGNLFDIKILDRWTEDILKKLIFDATLFFENNYFDTNEIIDTGEKTITKGGDKDEQSGSKIKRSNQTKREKLAREKRK